MITWNPYAVRAGHPVVLHVSDGPKSMTWFIPSELRSVTYVRETDDTEVWLSFDGKSQTEAVRCLSAQPEHPATTVRVDDEAGKFARDLADVRAFRTTIQRENSRLVLLRREALLLLETVFTNPMQKEF